MYLCRGSSTSQVWHVRHASLGSIYSPLVIAHFRPWVFFSVCLVDHSLAMILRTKVQKSRSARDACKETRGQIDQEPCVALQPRGPAQPSCQMQKMSECSDHPTQNSALKTRTATQTVMPHGNCMQPLPSSPLSAEGSSRLRSRSACIWFLLLLATAFTAQWHICEITVFTNGPEPRHPGQRGQRALKVMCLNAFALETGALDLAPWATKFDTAGHLSRPAQEQIKPIRF